jgi:hypothetical protein
MTELVRWDWVTLGDNEGRVDGRSTVPNWSAPPEVELEGEWLLFRRPVSGSRDGQRRLERRRVSADPSLLTKFVQLDEAPAERILDYARRHGPLGFCQHGDPSHRLIPAGCSPVVSAGQAGDATLREALQWWRNLAGHARSLLNAAAQLRKGGVDDMTLVRLNPELLFSATKLTEARRDAGWFVAFGMDLWLRFFQVRPRVTYHEARKRVEARIGGSPALAGALALQMMIILTRSTGFAICSGCGQPFAPSRRPNPNRNAYCRDCGERAVWRDAQERRRKRIAARSTRNRNTV